MNAALREGCRAPEFPFPVTIQNKKLSELINPGPAMTWVFVDEQADSINDAMLYYDPAGAFYLRRCRFLE